MRWQGDEGMRLNNAYVFRSLLLGKLSDDARISEDIKKTLYEIFLNLYQPQKDNGSYTKHLGKIKEL